MNWQEVLWALPSSLGWKWYALWGAPALVAAAIVFFKMIVGEPFSALLMARAIFALGLVMVPLCIIQPGYERWIVAPYSLSAVLIAVDWSSCKDRSLGLGAALWRWLRCRLSAGPRPWRREDLL